MFDCAVAGAERLLGMRPNGTGLRPGYERFDEWTNVPAVLKFRPPSNDDVPDYCTPGYVFAQAMAACEEFDKEKKAAGEEAGTLEE